MSRSKIIILYCVLIAHFSPSPVMAQTTINKSASDSNAVEVQADPASQAPENILKKLSDLIHAEKYSEAQQLTTGLLLVYPNDQRLIKAKELLDKLIASGQEKNTTPNNNQETNKTIGTQTTMKPEAEKLKGMDKVEYNSLIELARQAQQNEDLEQQKKSLKKFMDESYDFLQKYPGQLLLWQIRGVAALSLDDPDAGYEAGQRLIAEGAADSDDPKMQQLLSKLKLKGWLDRRKVEEYKKYSWVLGTWKISYTQSNGTHAVHNEYEVFSKSETGVINGIYGKTKKPEYLGEMQSSGEISWKHYLPLSDKDPQLYGNYYPYKNNLNGEELYPSGWQSPITYKLSDDKKTITMVFPVQTSTSKKSKKNAFENPVTVVFEKISDSQSQ